LKVQNLPSFDKKELIDRSLSLIEIRTMNRVAEQLDEALRKQFFNILESEDLDKLEDFLLDQKIDVTSIMEEEVERLKRELDRNIKR